MLDQSLFCIAHRGGAGHGPENTLATITHALQLGVDAIEIDVWDIGGHLFVTHDRRLGSQIPGHGRLIDQTPAFLQTVTLADGNAVPTLTQVLHLVQQKAELNIELKGPDCARNVINTLQQYVSQTNSNFDSYVVSSFDHHQLHLCKQHFPELRRGVLTAGIPLDYAQCCEALDAYSFHMDLNCMNQALVDDARKRGLKTFVYTVNEQEDMEILSSMGVDGVFTDHPEKLLNLNKEVLNQ